MVILPLLWFVQAIYCLGITVAPIKIGDSKAVSLLSNTINCISYISSKDDIILITLKLGDKIASQHLNVIVIDEFDNKLRQLSDISHDVNIIFSNLNSQYKTDGDRISIRNIFSNSDNKEVREVNENDEVLELSESFSNAMLKREVPSSQDTSKFYVCFDNIYTDKSWSFHPKPREVELFVDIKNMTTIKHYNYHAMGKYFNRLKFEHFNNDENDNTEEKNKNSNTDNNEKSNNNVKVSKNGKKLIPLTHSFSERDWLQEINFLNTELNSIVESLHESERILQDLTDQESILRDTNEEIYSNYTKIVGFLYVFICSLGLVQLIYYKWLLRKQKVLQ
jgi:hypothetical protein